MRRRIRQQPSCLSEILDNQFGPRVLHLQLLGHFYNGPALLHHVLDQFLLFLSDPPLTLSETFTAFSPLGYDRLSYIQNIIKQSGLQRHFSLSFVFCFLASALGQANSSTKLSPFSSAQGESMQVCGQRQEATGK